MDTIINSKTIKSTQMQILVNTDNHISGSARLETYVTEMTENSLKHYVDHITRTVVYLSDLNADKEGSDDIQCKVEVRVKGMEPFIVEAKDENQDKALASALNKVQSRMKKIKGKMKEH